MEGDYLEQFWVTHWNSRWADNEPIMVDVFGRLTILEGILRDVPPSSFVRPSLMHAQVEFLINHTEEEWRGVAEEIRHEGGYASLHFFCERFRDQVFNMFEGFIIEEEGSDGDWDADEVAEANEMVADLFSSDDEEEGVISLDDPNGPEVESGDEAMDDDAWVWKSNNPW